MFNNAAKEAIFPRLREQCGTSRSVSKCYIGDDERHHRHSVHDRLDRITSVKLDAHRKLTGKAVHDIVLSFISI